MEKEREKYIKYKEMFKPELDPERQKVHQERQYTVSQDPGEWSYVERLLDQTGSKVIAVPEVSSTTPATSGFTMPSAKPGDYPYFVRRAASWMLPVYTRQANIKGQPGPVLTVVRYHHQTSPLHLTNCNILIQES